MRRILTASLLLPVLVAVAGCETTVVQQRAVVAPRPQGVEGRWAATAGPVPYTANFAGGRFSSVEDRTGAVLAEGTYSVAGPGQVRIDYNRPNGEKLAANCNQSGDRMACASSTGATFDLVRI
ncbi:hypothetical protein [Consotaella salsifontis]|uniref:Outer membrane lipoprotein omp10 n=1 Tax=Consotaella salsifontis TaxID=1365950 RepID=A0A1T4R9F0_9HYPH|nr:hypothetical protein [Consotaella salsifontis]SKA12251.1 hypothetical protein SAMN05428963_106113 [Consotaella salsifontis]